MSTETALIAIAIGCILYAIVVRFVLSIPTMVKNQKIMNDLLTEIALKNGVDKEVIDQVYNENKGIKV
jgi:ABC-type uncharacterized transport system permease subunit